jgi:hypothetical protein
LRPSRTTKELHRPLGDALLLNVTILARIGLRYVLTLSNQGKRCFGSFGSFGKCKCLGVGRERIIIVAAVLKVGRTTLWVAPNAIFQRRWVSNTNVDQPKLLRYSRRSCCDVDLELRSGTAMYKSGPRHQILLLLRCGHSRRTLSAIMKP